MKKLMIFFVLLIASAWSGAALGQGQPDEAPVETSAAAEDEEVAPGDGEAQGDEEAGEPAKEPVKEAAKPASPAPPATPTPSAQGEVPEDEAQSYEKGFDAMRAMQWGKARAALETHLERFPEGSTAANARELLRLAEALQRQTQDSGKSSGRLELVAFSTSFGIWAGIATSIILELEEGSLLMTFATGGAGLGLSLWATSGVEVTEGEAALVSTLGSWGTWNGLALALIADVGDEKALVGTTLGVGVLGIASALVANQYLSLAPGDVALVSTGGTWGTFFAGMGLLIADADVGEKGVFGTLLLGSDAGLLLGGLMAQNLDVSRGRMRLIDLGGLLGTLLAGGVMALSDAGDTQLIGVGLSLGAIGGLTAATYASAGWDEPDKKGDDTTWLVPTPFVAPSRDGERTGLSFGLNVLQGTW